MLHHTDPMGKEQLPFQLLFLILSPTCHPSQVEFIILPGYS